MSLEQSFADQEAALLSQLKAKHVISDATGKGAIAESIIEEMLLRPFLPPGFTSGKGAVISSTEPNIQSGAIDRVIFDTRATIPLSYHKDHSLYPIEGVAGMVEITMHLDARKLKNDIVLMAPVKAMDERCFLVPKKGSITKVVRTRLKGATSPRSFIIGAPADPKWDARTIAKALRAIQMELGCSTHVHGLYVIGIGFFSTIPIEDVETEPIYRIEGWLGPERIFRFTDEFRRAFDRWQPPPQGWATDLGGYVSGKKETLAE